MGARTGQEYIEGLRDGRSVYVNGELVRDVTQHPPFQGVIQTLAGLYDRQHDPAYKDLLTYPSPTSGAPVSTSFIMPKTPAEMERRLDCGAARGEPTSEPPARFPPLLNGVQTHTAENHAQLCRSPAPSCANTCGAY